MLDNFPEKDGSMGELRVHKSLKRQYLSSASFPKRLQACRLAYQVPTASGSQRGMPCEEVSKRCALVPRSRPGAEERPDACGEPHGQRPPEGDTQGAHRHPRPTRAPRPTQEREVGQGRARDEGDQMRLRGEGGDQERQGGAREAARRRPRRLQRPRALR